MLNTIMAPTKAVTKEEGHKIFQMHRFLNPFPQLPAIKKDSKNGAARKSCDPSYFVTALVGVIIFCPSYFDPALNKYR